MCIRDSDWRVPLSQAIQTIKDISLDVTVQGNLDPAAMFAEESVLRWEVNHCLKQGTKARQHIFNVGHGVNQFTPIESIHTVIDEVRKFEKTSKA